MDHNPLVELHDHHVASVHLLDFGTFQVGTKRTIGLPGYLVTTDRNAHILIDTGFPPDYAEADRDGLGIFGHLLSQNSVQQQLVLLNLTPQDIDLLILTHSHIDHVGALPLFTCPILLTAAERANPQPLYFGTKRPMDWPDRDYRTITADTQICRGLTALLTPGHTIGHLSLLVTHPQPLILTADAINRASEPAEGFSDAEDPITAATSAARLFALAAEHNATLIYGHDPEQWRDLPKAPHPLTPPR